MCSKCLKSQCYIDFFAKSIEESEMYKYTFSQTMSNWKRNEKITILRAYANMQHLSCFNESEIAEP